MKQSLEQLQATLSTNPPRLALVLGSGLGTFVERFTPIASWKFNELPGLVETSVQGHAGKLVYCIVAGVPVLIYAGRIHFYEGHTWSEVTSTIQLAASLGVKKLFLTNAAGGIRPGFIPGTLMMIRHHLKWTQPRWWARGVNKGDPIWYSHRLNDQLQEVATQNSIQLEAGIYAALTGPTYETPSEIKALKGMGVDAVGMSTAMEAEKAYELGMETVAVSCITNVAAGLSEVKPHHEEVLIESKKAAGRMATLIEGFIAKQ